MTRKHWLFLGTTFAICAVRAFAQAGDEVTVGWDPMECWDCTTMGIEGLYAVMIGGPLCGVVVGLLRALSHRTTPVEPELIMVRFN